MLNIVPKEISTGSALKNKLIYVLNKENLRESKIIGCSFDGVANISGQYNGFQAHVVTVSPNSIFTWFYVHTLNLVVGDSIQSSLKIKTYFGLLNRSAL